MAPSVPYLRDPHHVQFERSYQILNEARSTKSGYCSQQTRDAMRDTFSRAYPGKAPYEWQIDVSEAQLLGIDCSVIAPTGAGKTSPFVMPLLVDQTKKCIIVSPLTELEMDQEARFRKIGLSSRAVNQETWNQALHQALCRNEFRVLLASPEMCLEHETFSQLLRTPDFTRNISAVIIDEAHCISQWGEDFRQKFAELGKLRSYMPLHVPFLATSATLPPSVLGEVYEKLHFTERTTFHLNLGKNRPNIHASIKYMSAAASDLESLRFLVENTEVGQPLERTVVFFESRALAYKATRYLRECVDPSLRDQIAYFHSGRAPGPGGKGRIMSRFRRGVINIMCSTEAGGMGTDIPNVRRIVQFTVPSSLSVWMQRAGRAGRAGETASAVLLVQPTVFQKKGVGGKKADVKQENETGETEEMDQCTDSVEYTKRVEGGLREWIETEGCRREVADLYFNNPPRPSIISSECCDNCKRKRRDADAESASESDVSALLSRSHQSLPPSPGPSLQPDNDDIMQVDQVQQGSQSQDPILVETQIDSEPEDTQNENGKRQMGKAPGNRRGERKTRIQEALRQWRIQCWEAEYRLCTFGLETILPEAVLNKLASFARIATMEDMKVMLSEHWDLIEDHGEDVLEVIKRVDGEWIEENERKKEEARVKRKKESELKAIQREEEKRLERARRAEERYRLNAAKNAQQMSSMPSYGSAWSYPAPAAMTASQAQPLKYYYTAGSYSMPDPGPSGSSPIPQPSRSPPPPPTASGSAPSPTRSSDPPMSGTAAPPTSSTQDPPPAQPISYAATNPTQAAPAYSYMPYFSAPQFYSYPPSAPTWGYYIPR